MKRFLSIVALACVLSSSALAGDIPSGGAPVPGPNGATASTEPGDIPSGGVPTPSTDPGEIPSGGFTGEIPSVGLSAVLSVLGFLA